MRCWRDTLQRMARKTGDLTLRLDKATRAKLDKIAERRLGRKRSTGTFLKMLAMAAVEREERSSELRQMLRALPADPQAADEIARRRREDWPA
jgi:DNA-binding ferritin-like protein